MDITRTNFPPFFNTRIKYWSQKVCRPATGTKCSTCGAVLSNGTTRSAGGIGKQKKRANKTVIKLQPRYNG